VTLIAAQLVKAFPTFYWTRRFINTGPFPEVFTLPHTQTHLTLCNESHGSTYFWHRRHFIDWVLNEAVRLLYFNIFEISYFHLLRSGIKYNFFKFYVIKRPILAPFLVSSSYDPAGSRFNVFLHWLLAKPLDTIYYLCELFSLHRWTAFPWCFCSYIYTLLRGSGNINKVSVRKESWHLSNL